MFYCHLLIIYKIEQTNLILFKNTSNNKLLHKNKKNLILKNIFQNNTVKYEFFNIFLISPMSTGSYNLKKKSFLNILHEVTYKLNLENCNQNYYTGKFYLKSASLVIINLDLRLKENFFDSKNIINNYMANCFDSNLYKKENRIQLYTNNIKNTIYNFNSSKSKLSTSFLDEIFIIKLDFTKKFSYYIKMLNSVNFLKNLAFLDLFSLKLIDLFVFYIRNLKATTKLKSLLSLSFSIITKKTLKFFTFFLGFFVNKEFFLSTEITFYSKIYGLNPIKYIIEKYFQLVRENTRIYSGKIYKISVICFEKLFSSQIKQYYEYIENIEYLKNIFNFRQNKNFFQKKCIERISEKIWNLKIRFSEFNFDVFFKKLKKIKKIYHKKKFYLFKWKWFITIYLQFNLFFYKIFLNIPKRSFFYKSLKQTLNLLLYIDLKGWSNIEIDSTVFFKLNVKNNKIKFKVSLKGFKKLIFKKYFKYKFNF